MMVYEIYSEVQLKQYFDFQTCTYLNYKIKIQGFGNQKNFTIPSSLK